MAAVVREPTLAQTGSNRFPAFHLNVGGEVYESRPAAQFRAATSFDDGHHAGDEERADDSDGLHRRPSFFLLGLR